jgi:hypothetical protein
MEEDHLRVGATDDQAKEVQDFHVAEAMPPTLILPEGPDLALHDVAQAEAAGKCDGGVFVLEDLRREILIAKDLEEPEGDERLHSPPGGSLGARRRFGQGCGPGVSVLPISTRCLRRAT